VLADEKKAGRRIKKKGRIMELSRPSPESPTEHFRRLTSGDSVHWDGAGRVEEQPSCSACIP
jgi:hypothetical protein